MESENPENREADKEFLSVKVKKEEGVPLEEGENQPPETEEEVDEVVTNAADLESLLKSINAMSVNSVQDLFKIKELLTQFENKRLYEDEK